MRETRVSNRTTTTRKKYHIGDQISIELKICMRIELFSMTSHSFTHELGKYE